MAKKRKAGEKISAYVDYLNNYDRKARGAGSSRGTDRFSGLDIRYVHDAAKDFGVNEKRAAKEVLKYAKRIEDKTKMGGKAEAALDKLRALANTPDKPNKPDKPSNPVQPVEPEKPNKPDKITKPRKSIVTEQPAKQILRDVVAEEGSIVQPISQPVSLPIRQSNPLDIVGDNNRVNQDNSITQSVSQTVDNRDQSDNRRFYGGSKRTFNYTGGKGESELYDDPVSKATMGGFYDTDDSPAAAAKFVDQYIDTNLLGQKDIRKDYEKRKITDYGPNDPDRLSQLQDRLARSIQDSRMRSRQQQASFFGDTLNFNTPFEFPEPARRIQSDADKIYQDALKKISGDDDD